MPNCDVCGERMDSGYVVFDEDYYCSDKCLNKNHTKDEYNKLYDEERAYWTEW